MELARDPFPQKFTFIGVGAGSLTSSFSPLAVRNSPLSFSIFVSFVINLKKSKCLRWKKSINESSPLEISPAGWMPSAGELEKSRKPLTTPASLPFCLCFHVCSDLCEGAEL